MLKKFQKAKMVTFRLDLEKLVNKGYDDVILTEMICEDNHINAIVIYNELDGEYGIEFALEREGVSSTILHLDVDKYTTDDVSSDKALEEKMKKYLLGELDSELAKENGLSKHEITIVRTDFISAVLYTISNLLDTFGEERKHFYSIDGALHVDTFEYDAYTHSSHYYEFKKKMEDGCEKKKRKNVNKSSNHEKLIKVDFGKNSK